MSQARSFYNALPLEERRKIGWLTSADIAAIRKQLAQGKSRQTVAAMYRVSYSTIQRIDRGLDKYAFPSS